MIAAPLPTVEPERLDALGQLDLLDSAPEAPFDALTRLAARLFGAPIALVSLVDADRQWFKSRVGMPAEQTPRDQAFCAHAILQDEPLVVPDATLDTRFHDNPLVVGPLGVRSYVGVPLRTHGDYAVGTLCVLDQRPREFTPQDIELLKDLAYLVRREILHRETIGRARRMAGESRKAASASDTLYQATFQHAAIGIAVIGLDGGWLRTNPPLAGILGRTPDELASLTFQDLTHPDDLHTDLGLIEQLLAGDIDHYTLEKRYLRPRGEVVWANLTVTLVRHADGTPRHFVSIVEDISRRRRSEQQLQQLTHDLERRVAERTRALQAANDELDDLYRNAPCGYYSLDANGVFEQINEHSIELFGRPRETLIGRMGPRDFFTEAGRARFAVVYPQFLREGRFGPEEFDLLSGDGRQRRINVMATALRGDDGRFLRSRTVVFDVTELHRTRLALQEANRQQHLMLDNELVAIAKLKDRRVVWMNRAFENLFGFARDEFLGSSTRSLYPDAETFDEIGELARDAMGRQESYRIQVWMVKKTGERIWVDASGSLLSMQTRESLWMMHDITPMKLQQEKAEDAAMHDVLTGLPNRALLMSRLEQALRAGEQSGRRVAVCFLDLDGFKAVNDLHGHDAGDRLLCEVARRLLDTVRGHDTVARLGGDEFVMVLTGLEATSVVPHIIERAQQAIALPVDIGSPMPAWVGGSFGVALAPATGGIAASLLAEADAAMYESKRRRKQRLPEREDGDADAAPG
jgi:diguanylate cyclase (GGDEF)-like protein/PAS domain S-box-containing protein